MAQQVDLMLFTSDCNINPQLELHCVHFVWHDIAWTSRWGMPDILEICQKCDMKYDMIDLHISTTIVHINVRSSSSLLLLSLVFLGFWLKFQRPEYTGSTSYRNWCLSSDEDVKRCLCTWVLNFNQKTRKTREWGTASKWGGRHDDSAPPAE